MRYVLAIVGVGVLVGGLGAVKGAQVATMMRFGREQAERGPPPEAVGVFTALDLPWATAIHAIGSLASERGVTIASEDPGVVSRIAFQSGELVDAGDVIVELEADVEKAQLASALAARELAQTEASRTRELTQQGITSQEELDEAEAKLRSAKADAAALRAQIARKVVRAPFAGRLGIRRVDPGQYLAPGTPITELEANDTVFVDFTLPQERLFDVAEGMPVRVKVEGAPPLAGTVHTVEPSVDASTRAMRLRAVVPKAPDRLPRVRAGMFADVEILLPDRTMHVTVPGAAVVHASYGDSVFIVEQKGPDAPGMRAMPDGTEVMVARQQFVRTGARRGDFVAILEGLQAGQVVVSAGAFKLDNGSPVFVSDLPQAEPELEPHPENR